MTSFRNLLLATVAIFFSACGGGSEIDQTRGVEPAAATTTAVETETPAVLETAVDPAETAISATVEVVEESAGETDTSANPAGEEIVSSTNGIDGRPE